MTLVAPALPPTICNISLKVESWQTLISNTPQTSFYVQNAQTGIYGFRVQAVDNAGNVQAWPASAQASTAVLLNPLAVVQPFNPPVLQSTAPVTKRLQRELERLHSARIILDHVYRYVPV